MTAGGRFAQVLWLQRLSLLTAQQQAAEEIARLVRWLEEVDIQSYEPLDTHEQRIADLQREPRAEAMLLVMHEAWSFQTGSQLKGSGA